MATKAYLQVATIGRQTRHVISSIQVIDGVEHVNRDANNPDHLLVAIEGESSPILGEIARLSGVIYVRPAE